MILAGCGGPSRHAAGGAPPEGAAAAAALRAAAHTMAGAPSYRFSGSVSVGSSTTKVAGEFQSPDRVHETIVGPGAANVEVVFIGQQVFVRDPRSGAWAHPTTAVPLSPETDPRAAFTLMDQAEQVSRTAAGFHFVLPPAAGRQLAQTAATSSIEGDAVTEPGGLSHLGFVIGSGTQAIHVALDYRDIGQAPAVQQPA